MAPATVLLPLLVTGLAAQDRPAQPPPPRVDAIAEAALDRWASREHHPSRTGVKSAACTVQVVAKTALGEAKGDGKFSFTRKNSTLTWSDPSLGRMLARRGWSQSSFDRMFRAGTLRRDLAKTTLTGRRQPDGGVQVQVTGDNPRGYRSLHFDARGLLDRFTLTIAGSDGKPGTATVRNEFRAVGERFLRTARSFGLATPAGELRGRVVVTHERFGKHRLPVRIVETLTLGDKQLAHHVLTFTDYRVNGAERSGLPTGKPGSPAPGPASRPQPTSGNGRKQGDRRPDGPPAAQPAGRVRKSGDA